MPARLDRVRRDVDAEAWGWYLYGITRSGADADVGSPIGVCDTIRSSGFAGSARRRLTGIAAGRSLAAAAI